MPIIKSAKKALRQSKKRAAANQAKKKLLRMKIKSLAKEKKAKQLIEVYSLTDKLAKRGIIHKNKAGRIKSKLAKTSSSNLL